MSISVNNWLKRIIHSLKGENRPTSVSKTTKSDFEKERKIYQDKINKLKAQLVMQEEWEFKNKVLQLQISKYQQIQQQLKYELDKQLQRQEKLQKELELIKKRADKPKPIVYQDTRYFQPKVINPNPKYFANGFISGIIITFLIFSIVFFVHNCLNRDKLNPLFALRKLKVKIQKSNQQKDKIYKLINEIALIDTIEKAKVDRLASPQDSLTDVKKIDFSDKPLANAIYNLATTEKDKTDWEIYLNKVLDLEQAIYNEKKQETLPNWDDVPSVFGAYREMFAVSSWENSISMLELTNNSANKIRTDITKICVSPNGKMIASASGSIWREENNNIKIWDNKGNELFTLLGHSWNVSDIAFSSNNNLLASAGWDNTIKLWDVKTGKEILSINAHTKGVNSVCFNSDDKMLASASFDKTIKLWDIEGKELKTLKGHKKGVNKILFTPNGKMLVSMSDDNTVKLWNIENGKIIKTIINSQISISDIALNNSGKILIVAYTNGVVKLWNMNTYIEIKTIKAHSKPIKCVQFRPNDKLFATLAEDYTIKFWNHFWPKNVSW